MNDDVEGDAAPAKRPIREPLTTVLFGPPSSVPTPPRATASRAECNAALRAELKAVRQVWKRVDALKARDFAAQDGPRRRDA
ncbi:hypothetical protein [Bradyrhizobium iriomotense]|uniref:hypothetical protein n=1 Tax=Bradyrhizobium iriomotense TaxID=441950 RepID=UPI001B8A634B|nr:hypothetical protein [Bradyrhizobium iriomotense]MBR1133294.1 hypothetical protein [Bradyrhizobium iriomotense]